MPCCGLLTKMKIENLLSYGLMNVRVTIPGFGFPVGVYKIGEEISPDFALRLINNKNAILEPYYENHQQTSKQVHSDSGQSSQASEDLETWGSDGIFEEPIEEDEIGLDLLA